MKFPGRRPANLGVTDGKLAPCPDSPNCVSSQAAADDSMHSIAALPLMEIARIQEAIESLERVQVIEASDSYLYAEFESKQMGFIDDVEFYRDTAAGVVHVRSASRLGRSDLGVNRKRIEEIRACL
ncbi:MAG: DUF1499 domain-containing protein [Cyanobacteria bacterium J06641_5]